MGNSGWDHTDDQPYFFLSYARTPSPAYAPARGQGDSTARDQGERADDPDYWVRQLFSDLSRRLRERLGLPSGANPGFMDREVGPGNEWPARLASALATCRVFVPLYSRRYFNSVHCGKEWSAFARRIDHYQGGREDGKRFIVPALWVPVREPFPPEVARYRPADFGGIYATQGFYGIIKLNRYRDEYETAVRRLADQIADTGGELWDTAMLPPEPEPYRQPGNAFGSAYVPGDGERRVLVTVAPGRRSGGPAPEQAESALGWKPYDLMPRPLAEEVADLATSLGYLPEVGGLAQHADELVSQEPPTRAMLLIVDLWAARDPKTREILQRIDSANRSWVRVMVVMNPKDGRTIAEESQLRNALEAALPHKLEGGGRAKSQLAIKGVPTLDDFGATVPDLLRAAEQWFLRAASASGAHDPVGK